MKITRDFSSQKKLIEYLEYIMDQCYDPDEYYSKLEALAESGVTVKGEEYTYTDLSELL